MGLVNHEMIDTALYTNSFNHVLTLVCLIMWKFAFNGGSRLKEKNGAN